jgi:hypothetical protein
MFCSFICFCWMFGQIISKKYHRTCMVSSIEMTGSSKILGQMPDVCF